MALTVTKKPVEAPKLDKAQADAPQSIAIEAMTIEQLADRYGDLQDKVAALMANPLIAQLEEVTKELQARIAEELSPEDAAVIKGDHWALDVSAAAKSPAKIKNMPLLATYLGQKTFMELASVKLTDVKKYCTPDQVSEVLDEATGFTSRRKITPKFMG